MNSRESRVSATGVPFHALVLDEEYEYAQIVADVLAQQFITRITTSLGVAFRTLQQRSYDAVVVDSAFATTEVLRLVRAYQPQAGIIVLSQSSPLVSQIVEYFQAGADDHLSKPFHPSELAARVLRRVQFVTELGMREPPIGSAAPRELLRAHCN